MEIKPVRPVTRAIMLLTAAVAVGWPVIGTWYAFRSMDRVDLTVTNHGAAAAEAAISHERGARVVAVERVAPGATERSSTHAGTVGSYLLRVRVGGTTFEDAGGPLLDDDGPHRFTLEVRDGGVTLTRQSNEGPYTSEMRPSLQVP